MLYFGKVTGLQINSRPLEVAEARAIDVLGTSGESVTLSSILFEKRGGKVSAAKPNNM